MAVFWQAFDVFAAVLVVIGAAILLLMAGL